MGNALENCCSSKKRENNDEDLGENYDLNDYSSMGTGGILNQPKAAYSFKYQDDLMTEYVEEHLASLDDKDKSIDGELITFTYFLKIYKAALVWNRVKFAKKKGDLVKQRRKALKEDDMTAYRQACLSMKEMDEVCLQDVLEEILEQIELGEQKFNDALSLYMGDPHKQPILQQALDDAKVDKGEGQTPEEKKSMEDKNKEPTMTKKEAIAAQIHL